MHFLGMIGLASSLLGGVPGFGAGQLPDDGRGIPSVQGPAFVQVPVDAPVPYGYEWRFDRAKGWPKGD